MIILVCKKGQKTSYDKRRGISLASMLSKILTFVIIQRFQTLKTCKTGLIPGLNGDVSIKCSPLVMWNTYIPIFDNNAIFWPKSKIQLPQPNGFVTVFHWSVYRESKEDLWRPSTRTQLIVSDLEALKRCLWQ